MNRGQTAVLVATIVCLGVAHPQAAHAQVSVSVSIGTPPPPLPVYVQPPVPAPDYIWVPGYWAWGPAGYFWVPGTWEQAPQPGLLWTPGYWSWDDDQQDYVWTPGYWGPAVGYYGGINYGCGYFGRGYVGADWYNGHVRYNTAVTRVNTTIIHNVYVNKTVIVNNTVVNNHVSYNGGRGGVVARPTPQELAITRRIPMTPAQQQHVNVAERDRNQLASVNHGRPAEVAVTHPFTSKTPPRKFTPILPADRVAAQKSATVHPAIPAGSHRAPPRPTPTKSTAPQQTSHNAGQRRAPSRPAPPRHTSTRLAPSRPASAPQQKEHQNPPRQGQGKPDGAQ